MANLDQLGLPNGNTYNFKDNTQERSNHRHYEADVTPLVHKTYASTSYYATSANDWNTSTWYFMSIKPDSWYKPWTVRFKIHSICPSYSSYESITYSTISGRSDGYIYANWNERQNTAHYYTTIYPLKQAGFNAGYGHAVGISILYGDNYTNSAYYRTFEVDYYYCENCTVTILDTPVKWANWSGTGSTNYNGLNSMNAVSRGLMESGDDNTYTVLARAYPSIKAGPNKIFPYTLFMQNADGRWESIVTSNSTATGKSRNTHGFRLGQICYLSSGSTYSENAVPGWGQARDYHTDLIDHRYSFNTENNSTNGTTANTPVYLVGSMGNDGLFYLDTKWWTQTLPTSADGKLYIYLGDAYDYYRMTFVENRRIYRYINGMIRDYAQDAGTVNGLTVEKAVPSNAVFTDNNTTYTFANGTNGFTVTPSGGSAQTVTVTPSITNNVTGSGTSGYIAKFNGANTITNGPAFGSATNTFLRNDGSWASPAAGSDVNVTQTATSTSANYEVLFSATADNTTRTEGARKNNNLTFNPSTGNLQATQLNGVAIGSSPKFTDTNTTYSMTRDGANVKLTPSSGSAQSVGLSDLINGLGEGTSQAQGADYLVAQYAGGGTTTTSYHRRSVSNVVNATVVKAALGTGSGTTKYLREDGTWVQPPNTNTTYTFANGTNGFTVTPSGGSAQTVTVTPSIANNVTGSGTSGYLTKFNGGNTITNGPQLGSSTTTFLSNAGTWLTPDGRGNKIFTTTPTTPYKVGDLYIEDDNNIYVCTTARSSGSYNSDDWGGAVAAIDNDTMENYVDGVLANAFGTNGGNVLWRLDANGKPYEFLVTDTPGNLNGKIWRWDGNGLRFSSSGYSGSYITLINSNGRFAADYLTGTFNASNLTIQNFTAAKISGGVFTRGNSNNNSGTIIVKDSSGVTIAEVDNAGFKFYGAGNEGSRPYFIFNNSVGFAGYNASGALTFQISTDEFHIKKLYADAQLTIGGYLKAVPVNNGTNKGISFVKAY